MQPGYLKTVIYEISNEKVNVYSKLSQCLILVSLRTNLKTEGLISVQDYGAKVLTFWS